MSSAMFKARILYSRNATAMQNRKLVSNIARYHYNRSRASQWVPIWKHSKEETVRKNFCLGTLLRYNRILSLFRIIFV